MLTQVSSEFYLESDNNNLDLGNCSVFSIFSHLPWNASMTDSIYAQYSWKSNSVTLGEVILKPPEPTFETIITSVSVDIASVVDTTYFSYEIFFDISIALGFTNSLSSTIGYTPAETSSESVSTDLQN
ncbi:unnamed protein product [Ambrosiozyma monospora]|uniref:Unnamed protein product n=1 Tax=Ambrosiozyma monospora TaxID=43982 RepID=A0A9W7DFN6_AMBMO|nr:unnamed protein product [Ambrosiozyma monospora]